MSVWARILDGLRSEAGDIAHAIRVSMGSYDAGPRGAERFVLVPVSPEQVKDNEPVRRLFDELLAKAIEAINRGDSA